MNKTLVAKALIAAAALGLMGAPLAANAGEVQNRIHRENARIDRGVRDGQLTYGEYSRLDTSLDRIQAQRRRDLRANRGRLTPAEERQLNREEDRLSDRISFDNHNRARQDRR
ncbi:MAG: hypothetical protein ABR591_08875 [Candidatus Velthaea sp.]